MEWPLGRLKSGGEWGAEGFDGYGVGWGWGVERTVSVIFGVSVKLQKQFSWCLTRVPELFLPLKFAFLFLSFFLSFSFRFLFVFVLLKLSFSACDGVGGGGGHLVPQAKIKLIP